MPLSAQDELERVAAQRQIELGPNDFQHAVVVVFIDAGIAHGFSIEIHIIGTPHLVFAGGNSDPRADEVPLYRCAHLRAKAA